MMTHNRTPALSSPARGTCAAALSLLGSAAALFSSPAQAADARIWFGPEPSSVTLHAPTRPDATASLTFINTEVHSRDETFDLDWRGMTVTVLFDWNADNQMYERVTVIPPVGYYADPAEINVNEGSADTLHIIKWNGM